MKIRLPLPLLAALAAAFPAATAAPAGTELGNVMYVGDSITHGVNSASYRWALHKIFTDNGISYQAEGVKTGNYSGGVTAGTSYGGQIFNNEHSSQASARAWEISGRNSGRTVYLLCQPECIRLWRLFQCHPSYRGGRERKTCARDRLQEGCGR